MKWPVIVNCRWRAACLLGQYQVTNEASLLAVTNLDSCLGGSGGDASVD